MNLRKLVKDTWCWKFINTKPGKYIKFFIILLLDMINLGVDWYFFAKVQLIEPGLVYGPPEPSIRWSILVFCIISIFSFITETVQNVDDLFKKKRILVLSQSLTNFFVIVFEDIPLLVLNLIVTLCRDGEPTVISVVKASVGIAVVIIRFVLMIFVYWLFDTKKSRFNIITDFMSTIGLFIIAGLSISIQLLNNFPTNANGMIQTTDPVTFNRMNYATDKYLRNVGIFTQWPIDQTQTNLTKIDSYLWLADITEVIDKSHVHISIRTDYSSINSINYKLCLIKTNERVCYLGKENSSFKKLDPNETELVLNEPNIINNGFDLSILKEPAQDYRYKIGYLDYNMNKFDNKTCSKTSAYSIIYAKHTALSDKKQISYLKDANEKFNFYSLSIDLLTVDKFWLTGIVKCKMSGDLGPKFSSDIRLTC